MRTHWPACTFSDGGCAARQLWRAGVPYWRQCLACRTMGSCSGGFFSLEPCSSHSSKAVSCSLKKGLGWNSRSSFSSKLHFPARFRAAHGAFSPRDTEICCLALCTASRALQCTICTGARQLGAYTCSLLTEFSESSIKQEARNACQHKPFGSMTHRCLSAERAVQWASQTCLGLTPASGMSNAAVAALAC